MSSSTEMSVLTNHNEWNNRLLDLNPDEEYCKTGQLVSYWNSIRNQTVMSMSILLNVLKNSIFCLPFLLLSFGGMLAKAECAI